MREQKLAEIMAYCERYKTALEGGDAEEGMAAQCFLQLRALTDLPALAEELREARQLLQLWLDRHKYLPGMNLGGRSRAFLSAESAEGLRENLKSSIANG